jgi:membrane fusion protein, copper/silver efflux system
MNSKFVFPAIVAALVLALGGFGLYRAGLSQGMHASVTGANSASPAAGAPQRIGDRDPKTGKRVLYWHDPMVPAQKFDRPGKSPSMNMPLVPVYEGGAEAGGITISPRVQQNLGVRTAEVTRGELHIAISAVGNVTYNERDVALVQARANGFLERLYVRAALDRVRRGQALAQLYVPDWVAAQEEYLSVKRMQSAGMTELLGSARERMRLAGMTDEQIRRIEKDGKVEPRLTITAPIDGVVTELAAREGMTVVVGAPLFRINGLRSVWLNAELPENVAAIARPGNNVEARAPALPGEVFNGTVNAILPDVSLATRTVKARIELANPQYQLTPGMFATVQFATASRADVLSVPSEAVIQTGTRSLVMVAEGEGEFTPVTVETGLDADGRTEIRSGLKAGQKVVVSGQFLVDSEANLRATGSRLSGEPTSSSDPDAHGKDAQAMPGMKPGPEGSRK